MKSQIEIQLDQLKEECEKARQKHGAKSPEARTAYTAYKDLYDKWQMTIKEWSNE
jgi:hypothetical protein